MNSVIKLSSPATHQFWEIAVLYEDEHLLALDKPAQLPISPDRNDPQRPTLMKLLHHDIARGAPWARQRQLNYLANAHRLDCEITGIILLAKDKPSLVALANQFGTDKPVKSYLALVHGAPAQTQFQVAAKLAPHPVHLGRMRVDEKGGKPAKTEFDRLEQFAGFALLQCQPLTNRTHQIRVHLQSIGLAIVGDSWYGGKRLLLSQLKSHYRLKPGQSERPLLDRVALHAQTLTLTHPATGSLVTLSAPWPKDMTVAVKYLRRYALGGASPEGEGADV